MRRLPTAIVIVAGARIYELGHQEAYVIAGQRATPSLESAEALASRMGAPECAVRPFPDP